MISFQIKFVSFYFLCRLRRSVADRCPFVPSLFGHLQTIVINTTLCGDWAGNTHSQVGCPGTCAQTVANPRNMDQAYWEINYVRLYGAMSMSRSNPKSDL